MFAFNSSNFAKPSSDNMIVSPLLDCSQVRDHLVLHCWQPFGVGLPGSRRRPHFVKLRQQRIDELTLSEKPVFNRVKTFTSLNYGGIAIRLDRGGESSCPPVNDGAPGAGIISITMTVERRIITIIDPELIFNFVRPLFFYIQPYLSRLLETP
jgi:hypothetical protein